jgi:hypothetical protein
VKIPQVFFALSSAALALCSVLYSSKAEARPMPPCNQIGIKTYANNLPLSTGLATSVPVPNYCYYATDKRLNGPYRFDLTSAANLTTTPVAAVPAGYLETCIAWNEFKNKWKFEPVTDTKPKLCGKLDIAPPNLGAGATVVVTPPPSTEPICEVAAINAKCYGIFLYSPNKFSAANTYGADYAPWQNAWAHMPSIDSNIPHCTNSYTAVDSTAPTTAPNFYGSKACYRKITGFVRNGTTYTQQLTQFGLGGTSPLQDISPW